MPGHSTPALNPAVAPYCPQDRPDILAGHTSWDLAHPPSLLCPVLPLCLLVPSTLDSQVGHLCGLAGAVFPAERSFHPAASTGQVPDILPKLGCNDLFSLKSPRTRSSPQIATPPPCGPTALCSHRSPPVLLPAASPPSLLPFLYPLVFW